MPDFATKQDPNAAKLRGGYYTPAPIAKFVSGWVTSSENRPNYGSSPRYLEPSCGDGAILNYLAHPSRQVVGVELLQSEAAKASRIPDASVIQSDFFHWLKSASGPEEASFDGVAGNPPYIRFGNWDSSSRELAFEYLSSSGIKPTRLMNAWLPFVVAAVRLTVQGGRIGLVLPAELLQVGYAKQLRSYLIEHCSRIHLVSFRKLVFPEVLQEVVLLLAEVGEGPAQIKAIEVHDAEDLESVEFHDRDIAAELGESEKWTRFYLDADDIDCERDFSSSNTFSSLGNYAKVNVGVVTGRNSFFCLSDLDVKQRNLQPWVMPLLARSAHVGGLDFDVSSFKSNINEGLNTWLLAVPEGVDISRSKPLSSYIADGEQEGVHLGYKTRIRKDWWSVPSVSVPDGFMLRQISGRARLFANTTKATCTDTLHRVFLTSNVTAEQLAVCLLNSITGAYAELLGRSYGGGILELEPSEAVLLPVPDPNLVDDALVAEVKRRLDSTSVDEVVSFVDQVLLTERVGVTSEIIQRFISIREKMYLRRVKRSRKS